jgi:hypothetical protein
VKRFFAMAILLGFGCMGRAQMAFNLEAPQDDLRARLAVRGRPVLDGLQAEFWDLVQIRLFPLNETNIEVIFAPKIATATNWWGPGLDGRRRASGPTVTRHPADLVLPLTVPETAWVSGLHTSHPEWNRNHTDLHTIGDAGYVEFYFANDGQRLETALVYYRADEKFVPLLTTNDFARRLAWEWGKFLQVKKLLEDHMPPMINLGDVEVSGSATNHIDLGDGTICNIRTEGLSGAKAVFPYQIYLGEASYVKEGLEYTQAKTIDHAGQIVGFGIKGKFYRMTPKVVEKLHGARKW